MYSMIRKLVIGAVTALVMISCASAAQFTVVDDKVFLVTGTISEGDDEKFKNLIEKYPNIKMFGISSEGGSVYTGINIAYEIAAREMTTIVVKDGVCNSMCPIIFLSGKEMVMMEDQVLGFHPAYFELPNGTREISYEATGQMAWWLGMIGVPNMLVFKLFEVKPTELFMIGKNQLEEYGLNITLLERE